MTCCLNPACHNPPRPDSVKFSSSCGVPLIVLRNRYDNTIKLWNLETGEEIRTLTGHSSGLRSVAIGLDGKTFVSGSRDKTIKIWRLE